MPANLKATKNRMMGKKSISSFMSSSSLAFRLEIQGGRVHAIAQAGVGRSIGEYVAEVRTALRTNRFSARHAVAAIGNFLDGAWHSLRKTRPAAPGIELRVRIEQLRAAA